MRLPLKQRIPQDTPRVIALALACFGGFALLGWASSVFERLPRETTTALALFAAGAVAAAMVLDPELRALARRAWSVRRPAAKAPAPKRAAT